MIGEQLRDGKTKVVDVFDRETRKDGTLVQAKQKKERG
jgi:hypothetical protein